MGVLEEYHAALGDLIFRFEGTLERFAGDGLMVFFNDPVRCDDGPAARDPDERRDARPGSAAWPSRGRARATTSRWASGSPRATRPWAGSASRAGTTTPRSAASPTWPPGCAPTPSRGRSSSPSGCSRPPARWSWARTPASASCAGFSRSVHAFDVKGIDNARIAS